MPQLDDGYRRGNRRMWYRRTVRGRCVPRNASNVLAAKSRRANVLSLSRHVPSLCGSATRRVAQNEARKRRASERHVVGCCEELGGVIYGVSPRYGKAYEPAHTKRARCASHLYTLPPLRC